MPVHPDSTFETVSLVLTKEQVRRLRAMRDAENGELRRVSFSDIGRVVVDVGLKVLFRRSITGIGTKGADESESEGAAA